ncbi:MAG: aspartate 1-decarboxylase [Candidatus Zixiibacteriota bacterium]
MLIRVCRAKIHRARVTAADLHYQGSITIDSELLAAAGIGRWEEVQIVNLNSGARFTTYVMPGKPGSGTVCLNGPAARLGQVDDIIIVIAYGLIDEKESQTFHPRIVFVDEKNRITRVAEELKEGEYEGD